MNLPAYLEKHGLSQGEFAKRIGVSQGLVWQWLSGKTRVSPSKAKDIEAKTEGEITKAELRPDIWEEEAA